MLETKNLCKVYKPKKGVPVTAVNNISLRFPERGMVFLLGKSGSGKSTMLNLLGGLDQYDSGEIIIKGVSSKDFTQQHFDSYRNTYVGFIFQEYNVLEEFTVGANIALALELQGRTATDEELNKILHAVDLDGFGDRKPNELSGGQKQRVAIARALVKNPEIIMADEPTGALDSATGRQVLDTLKKLSAEKLVIVVSHDREYAEQYADRIIELADGQVIRDVTAAPKEDSEDETETDQQLIFRSASIEIPHAYHLTEEDRIRINEYLDSLESGATITLPAKQSRFQATDTESIPVQDGKDFNLIKSVLPMNSAFKIGCSSLKHKKFRLVMTILLSVTAFTLFSLVDTFSSYNHIRACTDSLLDSDVNYISVNKAEKIGAGGLDEWWSTDGQSISPEEMKQLTEDTGVPVTGIFCPKAGDLNFDGQYNPEYELSKGSYNVNMTHFCGFAEITQQTLDDMEITMTAGTLPDGSKNEIAISAALADTFVKAGYHTPLTEQERKSRKAPKYDKITSPVEMVGKTIRLMDVDYTVSGIVNTDFDLSRYDRLLEESEKNSMSDEIVNYMLHRELMMGTNYSLTGCAMVGEGKLQQIIDEQPKIYSLVNSSYFSMYMDSETTGGYVDGEYFTTLDKVPAEDIIWTDKPMDHLERNDVIISLEHFNIYDANSRNGYSAASEDIGDYIEGKKEFGQDELNALLRSVTGKWKVNASRYDPETGRWKNEDTEGRIVGCIKPDSKYARTLVFSEDYAKLMMQSTDGIYDTAVGPMPDSRAQVESVARFCYRDGDDVRMRFQMNHAVTLELDTVNSVLKTLAKAFFWIGLFFAVFAALLMSNFISTSIHYKRQEIDILRAIGSRSADVFRIFFSESFVIAMINFAISSVLCFAAVLIINFCIRKYGGILITVLHFGARQIVLLMMISIAIAAVASFLPVWKIASKKPIDAIRGH